MGPRKAARGQLYASINSIGNVIINRRAFEEMGRPDAVVLMYEPETETIGLKPVRPDADNAFPVFINGKSGHRRITCGPIVREHNLKIERTVRFPTARVEDGVLLLELKYRVPAPGTRARSRTPSLSEPPPTAERDQNSPAHTVRSP